MQAGLLAAGSSGAGAAVRPGSSTDEEAAGGPAVVPHRPEVVVIGAGAFGLWTAYHLADRGVEVVLIDQYGPGNSRATSGGETRGVRTGYRDNELWTRWAMRAIERWRRLDARWREERGIRLFFRTGDLTLRESWDPFTSETRQTWERLEIAHDVLSPEEVRYRWPHLDVSGVEVALYEHEAGVVRARRVCEEVAAMYGRAGGRLRIARAEPGRVYGGRLVDVELQPGGERLEADRWVFALGPWFGKVFPELMGPRMRIPLGHVCYFGLPPGDDRFRHPHMPSYNLPGVTGWPALPPDRRGFRVRTGGRSPEGVDADPDTSVRYVDREHLEAPRDVLREWFPALAEAPLVETRACHYEITPNRQWMVDRHPEMDNVWLFGGGNAEGFKFSPLLGEYVAGRIVGDDAHPELASFVRISEETFD